MQNKETLSTTLNMAELTRKIDTGMYLSKLEHFIYVS